jgi:hypothetical protein
LGILLANHSQTLNNMGTAKFLLNWAFLSLVLLLAVLVSPLIDTAKHFFIETSPEPKMFGNAQMIYGIAGEVVRALMLLVLYSMTKNPGSSLKQAIKFGILTTGLVWTLWVVYGTGVFDLNNRISFFIEETIVFIVQGLLSGIGLYLIFRNKQNI